MGRLIERLRAELDRLKGAGARHRAARDADWVAELEYVRACTDPAEAAARRLAPQRLALAVAARAHADPALTTDEDRRDHAAAEQIATLLEFDRLIRRGLDADDVYACLARPTA